MRTSHHIKGGFWKSRFVRRSTPRTHPHGLHGSLRSVEREQGRLFLDPRSFSPQLHDHAGNKGAKPQTNRLVDQNNFFSFLAVPPSSLQRKQTRETRKTRAVMEGPKAGTACPWQSTIATINAPSFHMQEYAVSQPRKHDEINPSADAP